MRLPENQIYAASGPLTNTNSDGVLELSIDKFDPDPTDSVVPAAQWSAHRRGQNDPLHPKQIRVALASGDATSQVAAMSDALGQLANKIAARLAASR